MSTLTRKHDHQGSGAVAHVPRQDEQSLAGEKRLQGPLEVPRVLPLIMFLSSSDHLLIKLGASLIIFAASLQNCRDPTNLASPSR